MRAPIIHPSSRALLEALVSSLPQSILLSGAPGVGLFTIASWLAGERLADALQPRNTKGELDDQGTIGVEAIRGLYDQTRGKHAVPHIIIIDDADRMSPGAQAAFLKLLEEPNSNVHFVLTSHRPQRLLATITSRVQHTRVVPISQKQTTEFIEHHDVTDPTKQAQLRFIAGGLPAAIKRLLADEAAFAARAKIITDARTFLQADTYTRLLTVQRYQMDRGAALALISSALDILRRTMNAQPDVTLVSQLRLLLDIHDAIAAQHNIRLQLTRFVI